MIHVSERAELQAQIWQMATQVCGSVDRWDFKHFVLHTLFYRFISEDLTDYIEADDDSVNYAELHDSDERIKNTKETAIKEKGYFIYPSQLFVNIAEKANDNKNLNTDLAKIFSDIENSAMALLRKAILKDSLLTLIQPATASVIRLKIKTTDWQKCSKVSQG